MGLYYRAITWCNNIDIYILYIYSNILKAKIHFHVFSIVSLMGDLFLWTSVQKIVLINFKSRCYGLIIKLVATLVSKSMGS